MVYKSQGGKGQLTIKVGGDFEEMMQYVFNSVPEKMMMNFSTLFRFLDGSTTFFTLGGWAL